MTVARREPRRGQHPSDTYFLSFLPTDPVCHQTEPCTGGRNVVTSPRPSATPAPGSRSMLFLPLHVRPPEALLLRSIRPPPACSPTRSCHGHRDLITTATTAEHAGARPHGRARRESSTGHGTKKLLLARDSAQERNVCTAWRSLHVASAGTEA